MSNTRPMSDMRRYVLVDVNGAEQEYEYESYLQAYEQAKRRNMAVMARTYIYHHDDLVWTPNGDSTWPPIPEKE